MPTQTQISDTLFKKSLGVGTTQSGRRFYEEPILSRPFVILSQLWINSDQIPNTAPTGTSGVVQFVSGYQLSQVTGTTNSFTGALLQDAIPFNWGDKTSYLYTIKDSLGSTIGFGDYDWTVDSDAGILMFNSGVPSNMPPSVTFYRYSGQKGEFLAKSGSFVTSGETGAFVTTGQTGVYENADRLDGQHGSYYRLLDNLTGTGLLVDALHQSQQINGWYGIILKSGTLVSWDDVYLKWPTRTLSGTWNAEGLTISGNAVTTGYAINSDQLDGQHGVYYLDSRNLTGTPTGITGVIDADKLDGQHGAYYNNLANETGWNASLVYTSGTQTISGTKTFTGTHYVQGALYTSGLFISGNPVTTGNITNADTLDNEHGSYYLNSRNLTGTPTGITGVIDADKLDGQHGNYYKNVNSLTGTFTSLTALNIDSTNTLELYKISQDNYAGGLSVYKRGNTGDSGSYVLNTAELGYHSFYGWDGSDYARGAYVLVKAAEDWSTSGKGTEYYIYVTPTGTTSEQAAFRLYHNRQAAFYNLVTFPSGISSTIASPNAPLTITSTGQVNNLNVDLLDGQHGSYYRDLANATGTWTGTGAYVTTGQTGAFVVTGNSGCNYRFKDGNIQLWDEGFNESSSGATPWVILISYNGILGVSAPVAP